MFVIVHSGQTGVERGAHIAATACGIPVAGFMPANGRDELGPLPADVAEHLSVCDVRGSRPPIKANLRIASAVIVVVPDVARASEVPAIPWLLQSTRRHGLPLLLCDESRHIDEVARWASAQRSISGSRWIVVTGPRATRWVDGERVGRRLVAGLLMATELLAQVGS